MRPLKLSLNPFCIGFPGAMKCQATLLSVTQENGVGRELRAVVRDDQAGLAAPLNEGGQFARHPPSRDRGVGDRRQTLPRHIIDNVQDAEPSSAGELIMHEI